MNKSEEYLDFIEEENKLANEEKMKAYIYKTVGELLEKIINQNGKSDAPNIIEFIENNLNDLLRDAPHFTLLSYINLLALDGKQFEVLNRLESMKNKDIPAKSYSVIERYIKTINTKSDLILDGTASDEKILETCKLNDVNKVTRILFYIQARIAKGTEPKYLVELLNSYFSDKQYSSLMKLTLIRQLLGFPNFISSIPIDLVLQDRRYEILIDKKFDFEMDSFILTVNYFIDKGGENNEILPMFREAIKVVSLLYRIANLNKEYVLNNEVDIKSFCYAIFNESVRPLSLLGIKQVTLDEKYLNSFGYKEGKEFYAIVNSH